MKIFNEEEVENHINDVCKFIRRNLSKTTDVFTFNEVEAYKKACFKVGVEYAERKIEDLCIEFGEWINSKMDWNFENEYKTYKELFEQFLKEIK